MRSEILMLRNQLRSEQIRISGDLACDAICQGELWEKSELVYLYASFGSEVATNAIFLTCLEEKKKVAFPKVISKGKMEFYEVKTKSDLQPGYQGILEPIHTCQKCLKPGLMIVPGVAFDGKRQRIGYGGGYYDRYFATHQKSQYYKIGLAYSFQIVSQIETEVFDETVDQVISIFLPS